MQSMSGTIALVGTLAYVLSFAVGVGPVPGILVSEINAAAIRGKMHCQLCIAACGHHFSGAHASSSRARWPFNARVAGCLPTCKERERFTLSACAFCPCHAGCAPNRVQTRFQCNYAGSAMAFAMVTHWVCNFAIGQLFLPSVAKFGVSTVYLGFATVCVVASVFVQVRRCQSPVDLPQCVHACRS